MADKKITELTELDQFGAFDKIPVVDVSDTTQSGDGSTKYMLGGTLLNYLSTFYAPITAVFGDTRILTETHSFVSGLTFKVHYVQWLDAGTLGSDNFNENVTLSAGDDYNPRIDAVVLDLDDYSLDVVEGEAGASPSTPSLLPNQLVLFTVTVPALASSISGVTDVLVHDEDVGSEYGEWDAVGSGSVDVDSIDDASNGLTSIKFPSGTIGQYATLTIDTPQALVDGILKFQFKQPTAHNYKFSFVMEDTSQGLTYPQIVVEGDVYGIDSTNTEWQEGAIALPNISSIDKIRIVNLKNNSLIYFDEIYLQTGLPAAEVVSYLPTGGYNGTAQDLYDLIGTIDGGTP